MEITPARTGTPCRQIATLLTMPLLLVGCSVYDFKQALAPANSALLIHQDGPHNRLSMPVVLDSAPQYLSGVRVNPEQIPVTPSRSLAVATDLSESLTPVSSLEQAQKTLIRYLAAVEEQPERVEKLIADAEQLAQRYSDDALMQSLLQRLLRYSDWQPVNSIINNAGIDFVSFNSWQPESPFIRTRRALLPPVADNEHVIFGDQRLVLLMTNTAAVALSIGARLDDIPFLPASPTTLIYQLDGGVGRQVELVDNADWLRFTVIVPAGEHALRLYQQQPVGNQYVKLKFDENSTDLAVAQERPYFISTAAAPLTFYSQGPSSLRIDELDDGLVSYRYQNVPEGWHTISLPPPAGKPRSLLRVSQRIANLQPKPLRNRIIQRSLFPVPPAVSVPKAHTVSDKVELVDAFALGRQEDGTWSSGIDYMRRNNKQESGSTLPLEQFAQYRMNYRYFDEPHAAYWNSQGLFRIREYGGPTFGFNESVYYNPEWLPFNVHSSAKVFTQAPHDDWEALAQWDISIAQAYNLHPKTRIIPGLSFFARVMTLHDSPLDSSAPDFNVRAREIDQDVYTPYKAQHSAGLTPALSLEHRPWLDTVWSVKGAVQSYEDLNFTNPDHYRSEFHWQQLLGSVVLDASYRTAFYQANGVDRPHAVTRSFAELELNWQHWTRHQNRIEVSAQYGYDMQRDAHLATLSLTYHFGEGRGLRDFAPHEIDFRDIRQRQSGNADNNVMRDAGASAQ